MHSEVWNHKPNNAVDCKWKGHKDAFSLAHHNVSAKARSLGLCMWRLFDYRYGIFIPCPPNLCSFESFFNNFFYKISIENLILSASHCFTHVSESDIVFFIGKIHNNFTILKDEKDAKLYGVKKVIRHPLYLDQIGNYGSDIAVVLLNETVELNDDIHPVCLDLKLEEIVKHLKGGSIGYSTGMGINENDTNSEIIRIVKLPVISNRKCIEQQSRDFKKFIRLTTFCAGWANGESWE